MSSAATNVGMSNSGNSNNPFTQMQETKMNIDGFMKDSIKKALISLVKMKDR